MYAARAVADMAVMGYPDADISFIIVWMPMLPSDDEAAAQEASRMFDDPRVHQFWDANRRTGTAFSRDVFPRWIKDAAEAMPPDHMLSEFFKSVSDTPPGKRPLWDIVLFFGRKIEWTDHPPKPNHWAKQIAYFGRQDDGTSGLFWRNDFATEPSVSDWFAEVSHGMAELTKTSQGEMATPDSR